jgi:hypothetical protein
VDGRNGVMTVNCGRQHRDEAASGLSMHLEADSRDITGTDQAAQQRRVPGLDWTR